MLAQLTWRVLLVMMENLATGSAPTSDLEAASNIGLVVLGTFVGEGMRSTRQKMGMRLRREERDIDSLKRKVKSKFSLT